MATVNDWRKEYNQHLKKEKELEIYIDSKGYKELDESSKEKILGQYKDVLNKLEKLLGLIKYYKPREILEGFEVKEYSKWA